MLSVKLSSSLSLSLWLFLAETNEASAREREGL